MKAGALIVMLAVVLLTASACTETGGNPSTGAKEPVYELSKLRSGGELSLEEMERLAKSGAHVSEELVGVLQTTSDPTVTARVMAVANLMEDSQAAEPLILTGLRSSEEKPRVAAIRAAAKHRLQSALPILRANRQPTDPRELVAVLAALSAIPHPENEEFIEVALASKDERVFGAAVLAARSHATDRMQKAVLSQARSDNSEAIRKVWPQLLKEHN